MVEKWLDAEELQVTGGRGRLPAVDQPTAHGELLDLSRTAAGIGTFDWDLTTGVLGWDEQLLDLFGLDAPGVDQTIEGFTAQLHHDDLDRVTALLQQAIDTCGDYEAEYRILRADGQVRWVAARGRALCDEAGTTVRVLGASWDVTSRRQAQDRVVGVLEGMAEGFIAVDRDWVMTMLNARAEQITGLPREQLLGRTLWEAFPGNVGTVFEDSYRRAAATGQTVTFEAFYPAPLDVWLEVRAVPGADGMSMYFLDITARHRTQQRNELLAQVGQELTGTLDAEEAVARLAHLVVPALADWCLVTLVGDEQHTNYRRTLCDVGFWHTDPHRRALVAQYADLRIAALTDDSFVARALTTHQPVTVERDATARILEVLVPGEAAELIRELAPESFAVLPLRGRDRITGLLSVFNGPGRGPIPADSVTTAEEVAARAGLALDNARLYREQRGLAEILQRSLLTPPPEPDHAQVVVRYVPAAQAAQVGGDWYDAFFQPGGATVLVIGDVVGHDTRSAAAMGQLRTIVRTLGAQDDQGPAAILTRTDAVMETLMVGTAATVAVARLEQTPQERERGITRLRWSNAGHPPPFAINPDGSVFPLTGLRADLLLGVRPDGRRREFEVVLDRDSVVVLYTDGLVERRDQDLDQGLQRLQDTLEDLAGRDLDELCDQLLVRMLPEQPDDDVALVAVRLHPQDRPRPAEAGSNVVPPDVPDEAGP